MAELILNNGKIAIIDDEDLEITSYYKWQDKKYYVGRNTKKQGTLILHRIIMGATPGMVVDHINGDILDNRKSNLRICTQQQNCQNRKQRKGSFKGIYKNRNRWIARIGVNKKSIYLGSFKNPKEAAQAYNKAAALYFGEFAQPNKIRGG